MRGRSRLSVVLFGSSAIFLGVAAIAWACTNPETSSVHPSNARPGDTVSFSGSNFPDGAVDVFWEGTWVDSAQVSGGGFVVSLTVPEVADGKYWIYAYFESAQGRTRVGSCLGVSAAGDMTCSGGDEDAPATGPGDAVEGDPDAGRDGVDESNPEEQTTRGDERTRGGRGSDTAAATSGSGRSESRGGTGPVLGTVTPVGAPPVVTTDSGKRVFGGSVGPEERLSETGLAGPYGSKLGVEPAWSATTGTPSLRPLLVGGLADPAPASSPYRAYLLAGAALFAVGLVLLLGGAVVAEVRRARARAEASLRRHHDRDGRLS